MIARLNRPEPVVFRRTLWTLVLTGTAISLALAFGLYGVAFDVDNARLAGEELRGSDPLGIYSELNQGLLFRWPYPPGFLAWVVPSIEVANGTGLPFHGLLNVPMVLAGAVLALIVQAYLGARGAGHRERLVSAAAIALGPVFIGVSGYHGQLDALAILPAAIALIVWEGRSVAVAAELGAGGSVGRAVASRLDGDTTVRVVASGLLIGTGAALKTVPIILLVALVPTARRARDAALLIAAAAAIPLLLLAPFLVADPDGVLKLGGYSGAPGLGGLGMVAQPDLAREWLLSGGLDAFDLSPLSSFLFDHGERVVQAVLAGTLLFLFRFRQSPVDGAVIVWVAVYAFSPNFFFQYLIWGIPFFLMAGYLRGTVALQVAVLAPLIIAYLAPWPTGFVLAVYVPLMSVVWVGFLVALARLIQRATGNREDRRVAWAIPDSPPRTAHRTS